MVKVPSGILGVVLFARHADRIESFASPSTWTTLNTFITPLGTAQAFQLGSYLRATYLNSHSPSTLIEGINTDIVDIHQVLVRADSSGDGTVFQQSASAVIQGLYPPTTDYTITLANGTTVLGALGGYQYIPLESVEQNEDVSLNGLLSCPNLDQHIANFHSSEEFQRVGEQAASFYKILQPYLGGHPIDPVYMYNIWDFVDVQMEHNRTYLQGIPDDLVKQARDYANYHDANAYSDPNPSGIGNVGVRVMLPSLFSALDRIANGSDPLKLSLNGISYKPFISLFNVTEATKVNPEIRGIENYASIAALEVRATSSGEPSLRLKFKNGTEEQEFRTLTMFGKTDVLLSEFVERLTPIAINTTAEWCLACNQTTLRGCEVA